MIWFTCQKCYKKHSRPESSVGSLVFCSCGQGNTVPWESTAEAEPMVTAEMLPPAPELAPVKFNVEPSIARESSSRPFRPPERDNRVDRSRRSPSRNRVKARDPSICRHHAGRSSQAICVDCNNGFCQDCLVQLQGKPLCGPCKNQRAKALHKASPTSQLALMSLLLAFFTGPLAFCLQPVGRDFSVQRLSVWALMPQLSALGLGIWALWVTEHNHRLGGKSLAISAIATASFALLWTLFMTLYAGRFMST